MASNPYDDALVSATPDNFRRQLRFIRRHFDVPPVDELVSDIIAGRPLVKSTAMVTFDDGYRDNFEIATPILKEMSIPGLFFIPTGYMENPQLPWWDAIAYIIKQSRLNVITISEPTDATFPLTDSPRWQTVRVVLRLLKRFPAHNPDAFVTHLSQRAEVDVDPTAAGRWIVNWDELRSMLRDGMSIGSHTHSHRMLSGLSEADQQRELQTSKDILERQTGRPVTILSYPIGSKTSFTAATKRAAESAGYELAFSFYGGVNDPVSLDRFDVHRVGVERDEADSLFRTRAIFHKVFGRAF